MLNVFPIQFLALLAYFLLRLFVGGVLVYVCMQHLKQFRSLSKSLTLPWFPYPGINAVLLIGTEILIACSILLGAYTQIGALLLIILSTKMLVLKKYWSHPTLPDRLTYVLLIGCGLSLLITGAGVLAFDLPI